MRALRLLAAALILWAAITLAHLSARGIANHYFHLHLH
jgi:hypothetical protein